ncbi:MAG TPA: outer membrane protein transport protein [Calditrichia bacterium]|nr:outer membrane protein transport protein [Calditrichia bacterium]
MRQIIRLTIFLLLPATALLAQNRPLNDFDLRHIQVDFFPTAARTLSMGGAGIALSDDASATMLNPAGVALFNRPAFAFSSRLRQTETEVPSPTAGDMSLQDNPSLGEFDQIFLNVILTYKHLRFASYREVVVDTRLPYTSKRPFMVADADPLQALRNNFPAREVRYRLRIVDNTSSLALRLTERINIGGTLRLTSLDYSLSETGFMPASAPGPDRVIDYLLDDSNIYFMRNADERRWGAGFSGGLLVRLNSRMLGGFTYNYRPAFDIRAETRLPRYTLELGGTVASFAAGDQPQISRIRFDIPDSYGFGISYRYPGYFNAALDLTRIFYSQLLDRSTRFTSYENLIQNDDDRGPGESDLSVEDRWQVNFGMEYIFKFPLQRRSTRLPVRLGYYYDPPHQIYTTVNNPLFRALYPEAEGRHHFTTGLGFFAGGSTRFDAALHFSQSHLELLITSVYTF